MDVRLPDGTIIQNVPEGTTKADLVAKLKSNGMSVPAEWEQGAAPPVTAAPMSRAEKFGQGLVDPINGGAQLLTKMLPESVVKAGNQFNNWLADKTGLVGKLPEGGVDQQVREQEAKYKAAREAAGETGIDWTRVAGNMVNPATLAPGAALPKAVGTLGKIGVSALSGGLSSLLAPVTQGDNFAEEKAKQVGLGAAFGGLAPVVAAGLSRVISPLASTNPQLQLLKAEGVSPTVGQTLGGFANRAEEKLQSLPVVGDAIAAARNRAREQFNVAAINRAGAPIGAKANGIGQDAVADMGNKISAAYDAAKSQLGHFQLDRQAAQELSTIRQMANNLGDKERSAFDAVWSRLDQAVSPNGSIRAEAFKQFDSKATQVASQFKGSPDAYQQQLGDAVKELQRIVLDAGKRANPKAAEAISKADEAWANLVRVEGAAKGAMNTGGVFTPGQLQTAVRQADTSVRDRATARGSALMQDLSGAGQNLLGNKVPNSGTADRLMLGGGAMGAAYMYDPLLALGLGAGAAAYSQPAQWALRGLLSARPKAAESVAGLLEQSTPMLGAAGGLLSTQVLK